MAGDVSLNPGDDNDCCRNWKEKYSKLEEKRNALRQAVKLLEIQLNKVQAECATHKKACEVERAHAEAEKKEREKLVTVQAELEEKICSLELEASSFQQKGCPDAKWEEKVKLLEEKISKGEVEFKNLKEILKKEKSRADLEKKYALSEKKRAADAWKAVEAEKSKADEERRNYVEERKKLEQCRLEAEKLKEEVDGFRSRLAVEAVKYEETCEKHELDRHKAMKEKKRADKEKSRADEQRRLADESSRKLIEENARVVKLREEVEAGKQKLAKLQDEKNRLLGFVNRGLLEEKDRADKFSNDVRMQKLPEHLNRLPLATGLTTTLGTSSARWDNGLSENLPSVPLGETTGNLNCQKEKKSTDSEIMKESGRLEVAQNTRKRVFEESKAGNLSKDLVGKRQRIDGPQHQEQFCQKPTNLPAVKSSRSKKAENMKLKLCKEQLKLEKMKSKHAKEVLEFERCRNNILSNEIRQMRFDFGQYSRRLDALDSFVSPNAGAVSEMGKNVRKYMDIVKNSNHGSEPFHPGSLVETELFQSSGRGSSSDFVSGTDPQLEFSHGASLRKKLQSSAINSAVASFSDRGFLGSQGRASSPAAIATIMEDEDVETECNGNVTWPTKNIVHNSLQDGDPGVQMLQQKMPRSIELTDCRDSICPNASTRHHYRLDDYMENKEGFSGDVCSDLDGVTNLIGAGFDYMRLLELDNAADENRYKTASARLLSPLHDSDLLAVDSSAVVGNVSQRIGPSENGNHFVLSTANVVESGATESNLDCVPCGTLSFVSSSGNQHGYPLGAPQEFCVISSDITDIESISNIFKATRSCMVQVSLPSQSGHPVPSISILSSMEEKLPAREKMCVFFSVLLLKLSHAWPGSASRGLNRAMLNCMNSFKELLITVMADDNMRSLFQQDSQVEYLLHIIEDFLMNGRVAFLHGTCYTPVVSSIRDLGTAWNGSDGLFPPKAASTDLLLGGGVVLASICATTNNIGFLCEASYRIFQMHSSDTSLLLTILHAFSYICGKQYFTFPSYGTLMTVLKSVVSYAEDSLMSASSGSCPMLSDDGSDVGSSSCIGCPFRLEAVSMDEIAVRLTEKVEEAIRLSAVQYNEAGLWLLKSGMIHYEGIDRNNVYVGSSPISQCGKSVVQSEKNLGDDLNHSIELLSLLELIANVVGWEFTHNKIIPSLLSVFSSCISVPIGAGVMVLIGQLGRIGVLSHGYDDVRVEALRNKLCEVVRQVTASTSDASFTVQMAVLNSLLSLLPIDFVNIVGEEDHGGTLTSASSQSQSLAASSIREWYTSLIRECQVLADGILSINPLPTESRSL